MSKFRWFLILFVRYVLTFLGVWQLDILCANLVYPVRDELFYFWFTEMTKWDAYALFFWTLGIGLFIPEIVYILINLRKRLF